MTDGMDLPIAVQQDLHQLDMAYANISTAIRTGNLEQTRTSFADFRELLRNIDVDAFSGHANLVWRELSMLLTNDGVEGSEVIHREDARRVYESLQVNMQRLTDQFQLAHLAHLPQKLDVPVEFQTQLHGVWQAYLEIGDALAADSFDRANQAVSRMELVTSSIDMKLLADSRSHNAWMKELPNLQKIIADMQATSDLTAMRGHFESLSGETQVLARTFGFGRQSAVYQLHCPMAFGNKGAIWLQDNDQTKNPYFGTTMPRCADRVELIAGESRRKD